MSDTDPDLSLPEAEERTLTGPDNQAVVDALKGLPFFRSGTLTHILNVHVQLGECDRSSDRFQSIIIACIGEGLKKLADGRGAPVTFHGYDALHLGNGDFAITLAVS